MTPLKSIRKFCLWCCCDQRAEVRKCTKAPERHPKIECPFYLYRFGKRPKIDDKPVKGSPMKLIKLKCLDCGNGTAQAVRNCEFKDCPIYPYRNGKNPARKAVWANMPKDNNPFKNSELSGQKTTKQTI